MKTKNDVMYFMNTLFFVGLLEEDEYNIFDCVTKVLINQFQDLDSKKLKNMLGGLGDLYISFRTQESGHTDDKVQLLREHTFKLIKEKMIHDELNN